MGLFSSIKSSFKKSEAILLIQDLLNHQVKTGLFKLSPAKLSSKLVEYAWNSQPDIFDGKFGQRPHKVTVAATALAKGIDLFEDSDINRNAIILSLGNILIEIEANDSLYPLTILDHKLLEAATSVYVEVSQEIAELPAVKEIDENKSVPVYSTWEEWFKIFKNEAGKNNPQLKVNDDGSSLIDFMEHGPLKRAYKDGINPKSLANDFAAQFDIQKFGQ